MNKVFCVLWIEFSKIIGSKITHNTYLNIKTVPFLKIKLLPTIPNHHIKTFVTKSPLYFQYDVFEKISFTTFKEINYNLLSRSPLWFPSLIHDTLSLHLREEVSIMQKPPTGTSYDTGGFPVLSLGPLRAWIHQSIVLLFRKCKVVAGHSSGWSIVYLLVMGCSSLFFCYIWSSWVALCISQLKKKWHCWAYPYNCLVAITLTTHQHMYSI